MWGAGCRAQWGRRARVLSGSQILGRCWQLRDCGAVTAAVNFPQRPTSYKIFIHQTWMMAALLAGPEGFGLRKHLAGASNLGF